jgi:hypothetical protein
VELLQEFSFDILYVKGKENVIADVLSRRKQANAISIIRGGIVEEIKRKYGAYSYNCAPFYALAQGESP